MKIISAVYSHPEFYPPTLNAIDILSAKVSEITILFRDVKPTEATYPTNVKLVKSGRFKTIRATEVSSYFWKIKSFLRYTFTFYQLIKKTNPEWVIVYDSIPLLAYSILSKFLIKKPKLWYHNHDVLEESRLNKFSVSWLALKNESGVFSKIDLFSLPSREREQFFPIKKLKGKYFFLPNFPLLENHQSQKEVRNNSHLKLIYQGHLGDGHGLMEIIRYIKSLNSEHLSLSIMGIGNISYINKLNNLIEKLNLSNLIKIYSPLPYQELKKFTIQHDIGLAILLPKNVNFKTASTSSNKIYEYIASSMPVILYDAESYKSSLAKRKWAFFTDLSNESLDKTFSTISKNYLELSNCAREDFEKELNFEFNFNPIFSYLNL